MSKKDSSAVKLSKWTKQKQMGLALVLLGILLFVTIGVFLGSQVARVQGLPELLPERDTLFYVSFDFRGSGAPLSLKPWLFERASSYFQISLQNIESSLTGFGGFAVLKPSIPVLILEVVKAEGSPQPQGEILKNFLVISPRKEAHEMIRKAIDRDEALATSPHFLSASQTLPALSSAAFTLDVSESKYPLISPFSFFSGRLVNGLWHINALLKERKPNVPLRRYHADLLKFFPPDPLLFLGGSDLGSRLTFFNRDLSYANRLLQHYGAWGLSFEEDLLPLVSEEYGFAMLEKGKFLFITTSGLAALPRLESKLPSLLSILMPAIREVTLPDGTKGKELYADLSLVEKKEEVFGATPVRVYRMQHKPFELFIAEKNGRLFVGNERSSFSKAVNGNVSPSMRFSPSYAEKIRPLLRGVNEIIMVQREFLKATDLGKLFSQFLPPFEEAFASARYEDKFLEIFMRF